MQALNKKVHDMREEMYVCIHTCIQTYMQALNKKVHDMREESMRKEAEWERARKVFLKKIAQKDALVCMYVCVYVCICVCKEAE
jgi:hypothetical protein